MKHHLKVEIKVKKAKKQKTKKSKKTCTITKICDTKSEVTRTLLSIPADYNNAVV